MKEIHPLMAISPIDGRYGKYVKDMGQCAFSEYALIKNRVWAESEYLVRLLQRGPFEKKLSEGQIRDIRAVHKFFSIDSAERVKEIEKTTKHDVKAVEVFLKEKLAGKLDDSALELIHFGLTSEDITNVAYSKMLKDFIDGIYVHSSVALGDILLDMAKESRSFVMLGRTHGKIAVPTTFGKEAANTLYRLSREIKKISKFKLRAKMNGAVGNYASFYFAFPDFDWAGFFEDFITDLGFEFNEITSQVEQYDSMAELFAIFSRINGILGDFCADMWIYNMLGYIKQKNILSEVGSSTMPQKVNPWRLESAEGNFQESNARLFGFMNRMQKSRLQRDITDSSFKRSIGEALYYSYIAIERMAEDLNRMVPNEEFMFCEANDHFESCFEAVQIVLRKHGVSDAYDKIKQISKGSEVDALEFSRAVKGIMGDLYNDYSIVPEKYIGVSERLVDLAENRWKQIKSTL